jgi:hypothetical protein
VQRAKAAHLADLRHRGDHRDPFADAQRAEEEAARLSAMAGGSLIPDIRIRALMMKFPIHSSDGVGITPAQGCKSHRMNPESEKSPWPRGCLDLRIIRLYDPGTKALILV